MGLGARSSSGEAFGVSSISTQGGVAFGDFSTSSGQLGTAIGPMSSAVGANSTAVGANSQALGANSVALGQGLFAADPNTVSVGTTVDPRRIENVVPGIYPTDAVDVWQLQRVKAIADAGAASTMAALNIPQAVTPGKGLIGFGVGFRDGQEAFAFGASTRLRDGHTTFRASASVDSQHRMVAGAGVGFEF
jgi:autotransporter adhesin